MATIFDIAMDLMGTCKDLNEVLESCGIDPEDLSQEAYEELDSYVMQCDQCGWWSDADEFDDEGRCSECQNDHE